MSNTFSIVWQFSRIKTTYESTRRMKNVNKLNFKNYKYFTFFRRHQWVGAPTTSSL